MSYRFLPWARRGLAASITQPDPLPADPPVRARFNVRVTLSTGSDASVDLRVHGPGDVIGLDPRAIVRTEPPRLTRDFSPDQLPAIEFDPPDLPWMFTPAAAGAEDRLRPWIALVVVEKQPGVEVRVLRNLPLPQLLIESPAVPADELPDLAESWAWAHVHALEAATPPSVAAHLEANPGLNVSRLLCPRRLAADRDYFACVVPAFEVGRLAGLGQDVPDVATAAPAWGGSGGVAATVTLPLYFHWEFRTGPAGDFEALARRLTPRPVPDTVGRRRMFIGSGHPALPDLPHDQGGIVELEGALRAPLAGTGTELGAEHAAWATALLGVVNASAGHSATGTPPDGESAGPPIYGGRHVKVQSVDAAAPGWLRELNRDPRHRAAAGLGAEIVRVNQERYMQAAWEQAGDVLAANALLDRARFLQQVSERVYRRHIVPLPSDALLSVTASIHDRVDIGDQSLARVVERSVLPAGTVDATFRRMSSPRSPMLTKAVHAAGNRDAVVAPVTVVRDLAKGQLKLDVVDRPPDGLASSLLLNRFADAPQGEVGAEIGAAGSAPAAMVVAVKAAAAELRSQPGPEKATLRPDLATSGVVLPGDVRAVAHATSAPVSKTIGAVLDASRAAPDVAAFRIARRDDGVEATDVATASARVVPAPGERAASLRSGEVPRPVSDPATVGEFVDAFEAHDAALTIDVASVVPAPATLDLAATKRELVAAVDPTGVAEARARLAVHVGASALSEGVAEAAQVFQAEPLDPIMVSPLLPEPLYRALAKADPDRLLPGVGLIPDDTVTMLETNPRFVEAYLVGANHEMNRELRWRRYATDGRGTPFRRFWDRIDGAEDIGPIHAFSRTAALGAHGQETLSGSLTILVRGKLLLRFPSAVIYAVPARANGSMHPNPALVRNPEFWGRVDPDVTFAGFDLTREDVEDPPGWYFVIAEQPTEPRFGFDTPLGVPHSVATWSDVDWADVGTAPNDYIRLSSSALKDKSKRIAPGKPEMARFGRNSADMAAISFQRPFRAAIHSSKVIAGVDPAGSTPARPILQSSVLFRATSSGSTR